MMIKSFNKMSEVSSKSTHFILFLISLLLLFSISTASVEMVPLQMHPCTIVNIDGEDQVLSNECMGIVINNNLDIPPLIDTTESHPEDIIASDQGSLLNSHSLKEEEQQNDQSQQKDSNEDCSQSDIQKSRHVFGFSNPFFQQSILEMSTNKNIPQPASRKLSELFSHNQNSESQNPTKCSQATFQISLINTLPTTLKSIQPIQTENEGENTNDYKILNIYNVNELRTFKGLVEISEQFESQSVEYKMKRDLFFPRFIEMHPYLERLFYEEKVILKTFQAASNPETSANNSASSTSSPQSSTNDNDSSTESESESTKFPKGKRTPKNQAPPPNPEESDTPEAVDMILYLEHSTQDIRNTSARTNMHLHNLNSNESTTSPNINDRYLLIPSTSEFHFDYVELKREKDLQNLSPLQRQIRTASKAIMLSTPMNPLNIDGLQCALHAYAVITSFEPLVAYAHIGYIQCSEVLYNSIFPFADPTAVVHEFTYEELAELSEKQTSKEFQFKYSSSSQVKQILAYLVELIHNSIKNPVGNDNRNKQGKHDKDESNDNTQKDNNIPLFSVFKAVCSIEERSRITLFKVDTFEDILSNTKQPGNARVMSEIFNFLNITLEKNANGNSSPPVEQHGYFKLIVNKETGFNVMNRTKNLIVLAIHQIKMLALKVLRMFVKTL